MPINENNKIERNTMKTMRSKVMLKENFERNSKILKRNKKVKLITQLTPRFKMLHLPRPDILHQYLRHREINQYLDYIGQRFSKYVKIHDLGYSHEQRRLKAIEIDYCTNKFQLDAANAKLINCNRKNNYAKTLNNNNHNIIINKLRRITFDVENTAEPLYETCNLVFIEGGAHAREWITISVALNIIHQLTEKSCRNRDILEKLRFFIVPCVNPDGYEYSMDKNRFWRKNRRPQENNKHIGADCNRNYDIFWDQGNTKVQRNTYRGDKPFSEPETRAMRNILHKLNPSILFFLSLHSYAQCIMYPWGFTNELPNCWQHLNSIALAGRKAIFEHNGRRYRCGAIARLQHHTISGSVVDYAFGVLKVPIALVMELPSPEYGFQPPLEQIRLLGIESWLGIKAMCHAAYHLGDFIRFGKNFNKNVNPYDILI